MVVKGLGKEIDQQKKKDFSTRIDKNGDSKSKELYLAKTKVTERVTAEQKRWKDRLLINWNKMEVLKCLLGMAGQSK